MLTPNKYNAVKKRWKMSSTLPESQNLRHKTQTTTSNHKGNVFAEPQALTKTPRKASTQGTVLTEIQSNMGPLTTPTKGRETGTGEPWTPTSNLKMLISAASPEIRNREKELCMDPEGGDAMDSELGEEGEKQISRKEKSLGLLCHKFLARYPDYPNPALNNDISLDDVATELNVERRRIYDIMNVLESLHMVSRLAKNRYTWHGRANLPQTLARLRQVGEEHRYGQQMQQIRQRSLEKEFDSDGEEKENEEVEGGGEQGQKEMFFVELPGVEFKAASVNSRKDKSLRVMSQKFVMLFLVSTPRVVSLEVAARILIGEDQVADQDKSKFKTKVRRLYDIANVLRSLKLIEKVHVTEERGRKPAFEWTGPEDFPNVKETTTTATAKRTLESRASVDNCAKNLFSSPGSKRSFTRHPSLIKLAKSIQEDRRKINSAPTSPVKNDSSASEFFPTKMAQLAAICKIQLDQQSNKVVDRTSKLAVNVTEAVPAHQQKAAKKPGAPQPPVLTSTESRASTVHLTPQAQFTPQPTGAMSFHPAQCSPLIPVLLPQHQGGGPYAIYMHPSSFRPHPLTRPQPTSLAVRSMTFEDQMGRSPSDVTVQGNSPATNKLPTSSPSALKRVCSERPSEGSPSKAKRIDPSTRDTSPKLCEILQARLKARRGGLLSNRPSPRALHLDPEFVNTPGSSAAAAANQTLEQNLETFLEKEEKVATSDSEAGLTPVRAVPLTPQHLHTETLIPTGYLIPISQQSLFSYKDLHNTESSKASTPTYNIYHTPTAGSRPPPIQEFTPTSLPLHRPPPASPFSAQGHRFHSPSPAILNFTLQNLGLIPGPGTAHTPEHPSSMPSPLPPHLGLHQRGGMVFVKPMSPVPVQHQMTGPGGQPLTLISLQQMTTPKGTALPQHSFFHTPVSLSPLATVVTTSHGHTAPAGAKTVYIPQRKLEVTTEDT
ncbi:transcription factor E2F8 isoform X1 [Coregonus clupeaformis]|uniref:transcription factor E2F8 isoform X1 n=3 Tax=Coregonus clupeaformis TaxID=59861 RepID=UPI001BDFE7AD|nr:transcription factor E2F8 isoform X1 [Coregonus clupeaformis]